MKADCSGTESGLEMAGLLSSHLLSISLLSDTKYQQRGNMMLAETTTLTCTVIGISYRT